MLEILRHCLDPEHANKTLVVLAVVFLFGIYWIATILTPVELTNRDNFCISMGFEKESLDLPKSKGAKREQQGIDSDKHYISCSPRQCYPICTWDPSIKWFSKEEFEEVKT